MTNSAKSTHSHSLIETQLSPPSVLLKMRLRIEKTTAYSVDGVRGSIARNLGPPPRTCDPGSVFQLAPPSVLLMIPLSNVTAYNVLESCGSRTGRTTKN